MMEIEVSEREVLTGSGFSSSIFNQDTLSALNKDCYAFALLRLYFQFNKFATKTLRISLNNINYYQLESF